MAKDEEPRLLAEINRLAQRLQQERSRRAADPEVHERGSETGGRLVCLLERAPRGASKAIGVDELIGAAAATTLDLGDGLAGPLAGPPGSGPSPLSVAPPAVSGLGGAMPDDTIAVDAEPCVHRWVLMSRMDANGLTSGRCKTCGETRTFDNASATRGGWRPSGPVPPANR